MKKTYEKPKVTRVALKPEEAVLTACKTIAGPGPMQNPCTGPGGARACAQTPSS
jgi:hypothetical protein